MKIAAAAPRAARPDRTAAPTAPAVIDDMGCCRLVWMLPAGEAAWIGLTDRLPKNGAWLATRLSVTAERVDAATAATAKGLAAIGDKRRAGEVVPVSWVDRLADLEVEELEALWSLDDAAAAAAVCPAWVEVAQGGRAVSSTEVSWVRYARILARLIQQVAGLVPPDSVWDRLSGMDVTRECEAGDLEKVKQQCHDVIRFAVTSTHGGTVE